MRIWQHVTQQHYRSKEDVLKDDAMPCDRFDIPDARPKPLFVILKVELQMCQTSFCWRDHQMHLTALHVCNQICILMCYNSSHVYFVKCLFCLFLHVSIPPTLAIYQWHLLPSARKQILIIVLIAILVIFKYSNRFAKLWRRKTLKGEGDTTHILAPGFHLKMWFFWYWYIDKIKPSQMEV